MTPAEQRQFAALAIAEFADSIEELNPVAADHLRAVPGRAWGIDVASETSVVPPSIFEIMSQGSPDYEH